MGKMDFTAYDAEVRAELKALELRWRTFLDRLEERVIEVIEVAKPEARELFENDTDAGKRNYYRFKDALLGQIKGVNRKAEKIYNEYIEHEKYVPEEYFDMDDTDIISDLQLEATESCERNDTYFSKWERRLLRIEERFEKFVEAQDYEALYKDILAEMEGLRDKFSCRQCGGPIALEKLYYISTYVPCPHCQTQNTFDPSTKVVQLQGIACSLAEQRCTAQKKEYKAAVYDGPQDDRSPERAAAIEREREAYRKFQRAVTDEVNKILPELKAENEKIFDNLIETYNKVS